MSRWILMTSLFWACTQTDNKESDIVDADSDGFDMLSDCDDLNAMINPDAQETCDGFDNDCDGLIDDADDGLDTSTGNLVYPDLDGDGYAGGDGQQAFCVIPDGWYLAVLDCDDSNPDINPSVQESCDGIDNNCNNLVDDADGNLRNPNIYYVDADGDGYGNLDFAVNACLQPENHVENATDCDDGNPEVSPLAQEVCDDIDNDCDLLLDSDDDSVDLSTAPLWYSDGDGDGFGDLSTFVQTCSRPLSYVSDSGDCNDANDAISPASTEVCDAGVDNDCNGFTDDQDPGLDINSTSAWHADGDGDGDGDPTNFINQCEMPSGYVALGLDCDDANAEIEGIDADGDGFSTCDGDCDDANTNILACDVCVESNIGSSLGAIVATGLNTGSGDDFTPSCAAVGEDLVYEWTAPATALYHFDVSANYEAAIAVYDGCYGNELACQFSNSTAPSIDFAATAGETYSIVIDVGSDAVNGNASLNIYTESEVACGDGVDEDNDGLTDCDDEVDCWYNLDCSNATCPNFYLVDPLTFVVPQGDGVLVANLNGAVDDLQGSCLNYTGGPDYSYDYESPATGCAQITAISDSLDPSILVLDGCGGAELGCGIANSYWSNFYGTPYASYAEVNMVAGEIYIIGIDAPVGLASGDFTLNVNINTQVNCDGSPISR